jgi:hypothetical protein
MVGRTVADRSERVRCISRADRHSARGAERWRCRGPPPSCEAPVIKTGVRRHVEIQRFILRNRCPDRVRERVVRTVPRGVIARQAVMSLGIGLSRMSATARGRVGRWSTGLAGKRTLDHAPTNSCSTELVYHVPRAGREFLGVRGPTDGHSRNPVPGFQCTHEKWRFHLG